MSSIEDLHPCLDNLLRFSTAYMSGRPDDCTIHSRPCPRHAGHRRARRARQRPRSCGPCRGLGLSPHLGGGASQHGRDRQRRDVGRDCPYRGRHTRPSGSAQAASCCRTMRPTSSPSSSERWRGCFPGRIDLGLGRAPGTDQLTLRALRRSPRPPKTSRRTFWNCRRSWRRPAQPAHPGGAGGGNGSAAVDSRIEPFRRDAGRRTRAALCLRLAFRARIS